MGIELEIEANNVIINEKGKIGSNNEKHENGHKKQ